MQNGALGRLIEELMGLPGIGRKTAQRLAFHILKMPSEEAKKIASAIVDFKERVGLCTRCRNVAEGEFCPVCADPRRDSKRILVVEEPSTLYAIEKTGEYRGLYHVLSQSLSALDGMDLSKLNIDPLLTRLNGVEEVILATSPTIEGEATALYIGRLLKGRGVKVSRIAVGIPVGLDLEFADEITLLRSLAARREL